VTGTIQARIASSIHPRVHWM